MHVNNCRAEAYNSIPKAKVLVEPGVRGGAARAAHLCHSLT
jgi:hypothetical protein